MIATARSECMITAAGQCFALCAQKSVWSSGPPHLANTLSNGNGESPAIRLHWGSLARIATYGSFGCVPITRSRCQPVPATIDRNSDRDT